VAAARAGARSTNPGAKERPIIGDRLVFNLLKLFHNISSSGPIIEAIYLIVVVQRVIRTWAQISLFPVRHGSSLHTVRENRVLDYDFGK
jgi:hypothetical protein